MGGVVNKPWVSPALALLYLGVLVFTLGLGLFLLLYVSLAAALLVFAVAAVAGAGMLYSIYTTRYIVSEGELVIKASPLIGGSKRIPLSSITEVVKLSKPPVYPPRGLRLFGASLHGGYYYIPGYGRAFVAVTNLRDCVLIKAGGRVYVVSPRDPDGFIAMLRQGAAGD